MFQDYLGFIDDLLEDMNKELSPGAIDYMNVEVEMQSITFNVGMVGKAPAIITLSEMTRIQAMRDLHRVGEIDLMHIFMEGFKGYNKMTLREFLKHYMLTSGNINFMKIISGPMHMHRNKENEVRDEQ